MGRDGMQTKRFVTAFGLFFGILNFYRIGETIALLIAYARQ